MLEVPNDRTSANPVAPEEDPLMAFVPSRENDPGERARIDYFASVEF